MAIAEVCEPTYSASPATWCCGACGSPRAKPKKRPTATAPVDVLGDLLEAERSELVAGAMAQLPILQREAIVLFTFEELSLEEIAKITGVDTGAVKSRLHRARESLRKALAPLLIRDPERRCL